MNNREQFEDWYVREYPWGLDALSLAEFSGDDDCGHYNDLSFAGTLTASWKAWQAASKASEQQLAAVVAENASVKAMNDCLSEELRGYESDGAFDGPKMHLLWWQCETPATDAYLAEVRAQGVEMFAKSLHVAGKGKHPYSEIAEEFASQLRQGADHEHR